MRTRLVRPGFWADKTIAGLPVTVRLTFIGLWGLSDDAGFFEWKPDEIAGELYRWSPARTRLQHVEAHLASLVEAGPVQRLDCGLHGVIPSMPRHRIQSGRHTFGTREEHLGTCIAGRGIPRPSPSRSDSVSESETDSVRIGSDRALPRSTSPLDDVAMAVGGRVAAFATEQARRRAAGGN